MLKFKYNTEKKDKKIVALIDADGDLIFKNKSGEGVGVLERRHMTCYEDNFLTLEELVDSSEKVFYEGDYVTIQFGDNK